MPKSYRRQETDEQRFLAKVATEPWSRCWTWIGSIRPNGYAQFNAGPRIVKAHRWAYEHWRGPIPPGRDIDHRCHNRDLSCAGGNTCRHRRCVNPWHLEPVTRAENLKAGRGTAPPKALANAAKTHCLHGHPLSGANVRVRSNGRRQCKTCALERTRVWRHANQHEPSAPEAGL